MLRFLTAGESHGQALVATSRACLPGLPIAQEAIDDQLRRRQGRYGRGRRMAIESDRAQSALGHPPWRNDRRAHRAVVRTRTGRTGSARCGRAEPPPEPGARRAPVTRPRPGHADLAGGVKYERDDIRDILERASARETAARVAAGAVARQLLAHVGVAIVSHVYRIGGVGSPIRWRSPSTQARRSPPTRRCTASTATSKRQMIAEIDAREGSRRHARRRLRGDRARRAGRPRQPRAVGSQARWTAGAGADVDPRDQGGRHRHGPGGRGTARLEVHDEIVPPQARRRTATGVRAADEQRRRPRRRHHQRRGPPRHRPT